MVVCFLEDRVVCLIVFGWFIVIDFFGFVNDKFKEFFILMFVGKEMISVRSFGWFDWLKDLMMLKNFG